MTTITLEHVSKRFDHPTGTDSDHVLALDDVLVRLARCCTPVPGDEIIGFVTRGRGVSVHRADCANAVSLQAGQRDRLIEVEWDEDFSGGTFVASIEVRAIDRPRLLRAHVRRIEARSRRGAGPGAGPAPDAHADGSGQSSSRHQYCSAHHSGSCPE